LYGIQLGVGGAIVQAQSASANAIDQIIRARLDKMILMEKQGSLPAAL
jgi:hypothetical protein